MIKKLKIKPLSGEWHTHRKNYINASEGAICLNLSEYTAPARLFAEKVGYIESAKIENEHTYWGKKKEDLIADTWEYYNPLSPDEYLMATKKIRKCRNSKVVMVNTKYPHLSFTPDRIIPKGTPDYHGTPLKKDAPLEIKTINHYVVSKWTNGIVPGYLVQAYIQAIIMESEYAEIVMLDSNNKIHLFPIKIEQDFKNTIITATKIFWEKVLLGRALYIEMQNPKLSIAEMQRKQQEIDSLEPKTPEHPAYEEFYKEKYKKEFSDKAIEGTAEMWASAIEYKKIGAEIKEAEVAKQKEKNKILQQLAGAQKANFDDGSYITYTKDERNAHRLYISIK